MVPRRLGVHGLPGLVALARRGGVPGVRMDGGRRGVGTGVAVRGCRKRASRTAGTIFENTRTPLTVWFAAGWYMTADPGCVATLRMPACWGWAPTRRRG